MLITNYTCYRNSKNTLGNESFKQRSIKPNVVTFRNTKTVLQEFYSQMKVDQEKSQLEVVPKKDKLKIVETAAKLIRDDIKALQTSHRAYPACDELGSDDSINFLSESLKILLEGLIMGKDVQTQIASTGQTLIQSA